MGPHASRRFHIIVDAFDCEGRLLADKEAIESLIIKLAELAEMKILAGPYVVRGVAENPGITAFTIIDFSHISIHTFTQTNEFCLDLFSCKSFDYRKVVSYVKEYFSLDDCKVNTSQVRYDQIPLERMPDSFLPSEYFKGT